MISTDAKKRWTMNRRKFLLGSSALVAGAQPMMLGLALQQTVDAAGEQPILLLSGSLHKHIERGIVPAGVRYRIEILGDDPVRQWRDELVSTVENNQVLLGVTDWCDFVLLRSMGMESGLALSYSQEVALPARSGGEAALKVFHWMLS